MDFAKFDVRKTSEDGIFVPLKHPYTGEALGDPEPGFFVRGIAARSVQSRLADMHRAAKNQAEGGEDETAVLESLHEKLIDMAMPYIIRANDQMAFDGKPLGDDPALIRAVLDTTFPDMQKVLDADGKVVMHRDSDGKDVPEFRMAVNTYAQQVISAAEDGSRFFGETPSD